MLPYLSTTMEFPPVTRALQKPAGLLAAGGDLSVQRLILAYKRGIFPWFNPGQPILWWSPDPRMVLFPQELHVPHSLVRVMRKQHYEIRTDTAFREVMEACAEPRAGQDGSWIAPAMIEAYTALHSLGVAHSIETWIDGKLAGGLYGVALGRIFYGESMFAWISDASKIAFVHLVRQLQQWQFELIDCQMNTAHLARFGAVEIPRSEFMRFIENGVNLSAPVWRFDIGRVE
ncbi:MAG: leucyl/phenylalanyl-tRNA--protein transferase [Sulfuriferula sp.]